MYMRWTRLHTLLSPCLYPSEDTDQLAVEKVDLGKLRNHRELALVMRLALLAFGLVLPSSCCLEFMQYMSCFYRSSSKRLIGASKVAASSQPLARG